MVDMSPPPLLPHSLKGMFRSEICLQLSPCSSGGLTSHPSSSEIRPVGSWRSLVLVLGEAGEPAWLHSQERDSPHRLPLSSRFPLLPGHVHREAGGSTAIP